MFNRRSLGVLFGAAALLTLSASAHAWVGQINTLKFSAPVALPAGVVLPKGSYQFEMLTPAASSEVIRVTTGDRQKTLFLGFTRSVERPINHDPKKVIVLGEARTGTPPPIKAWYPVDGGNGHEFIYR
jgi:hypothetical protein